MQGRNGKHVSRLLGEDPRSSSCWHLSRQRSSWLRGQGLPEASEARACHACPFSCRLAKIRRVVDSSKTFRFALPHTLLHGHWDDQIIRVKCLFISFPHSVAKSFHRWGRPCRGTFATDCICLPLSAQMHRSAACRKRTILFSKIVLYCSTRLSFTHVLHDDAPQECCNSLYQSLFAKCCEKM